MGPLRGQLRGFGVKSGDLGSNQGIWGHFGVNSGVNSGDLRSNQGIWS